MWKSSTRKQNIINNIIYRNKLQANKDGYTEKTHDIVLTRMITRPATAPLFLRNWIRVYNQDYSLNCGHGSSGTCYGVIRALFPDLRNDDIRDDLKDALFEYMWDKNSTFDWPRIFRAVKLAIKYEKLSPSKDAFKFFYQLMKV